MATSRRMKPAETTIAPLEPWEMVQNARRPDRPKARDYIDRVFANFIELHGDRLRGDDPSIVMGLARLAGESVVVIGQQKQSGPAEQDGDHGWETEGRVTSEGFRKATRAIKLAERFTLPVITLVDTPGPRLGLDSERQGIAAAIAGTIDAMSNAGVPTISVLIGEGGSEAALALGVADIVLMQQNAIYTPIAPEEGAETELSDADRAEELARALRLTSVDCLNMGIVDLVVPEPVDGSLDEAARLLKRSLMRSLIELRDKRVARWCVDGKKKYRNHRRVWEPVSDGGAPRVARLAGGSCGGRKCPPRGRHRHPRHRRTELEDEAFDGCGQTVVCQALGNECAAPLTSSDAFPLPRAGPPY